MRQAALLLVSLVLLSPRALAADDPLTNFLQSLPSLACGSSVSDFLNLSEACKLTQTVQGGFRAEAFLNYAKDQITNGSITALIKGVADATNAQILNNLSKGLDQVAGMLQTLYQLPYEAFSQLVGLGETALYNAVYTALSREYASWFNLGKVGESLSNAYTSYPDQIKPLTPSEIEALTQAFISAGYSAPPEGYDSATWTRLSNAISGVSSAMDSLEKSNVSTMVMLAEKGTKELLPRLEAAAEAEKAREEVEERAKTTLQASVKKTTGEKGAALAGHVAKVAVDNKDSSGENILNMSLATKYKKEAETAESDRALLELQVKVIADFMANEALTDNLMAEYLRSALEEQVMTTELLRQEVRELHRSLTGENQGMGKQQYVARLYSTLDQLEAERKKAMEEIAPAVESIESLCLAYGLGSCL